MLSEWGPLLLEWGPVLLEWGPALRVWAPCANPASEAAGLGALPENEQGEEEEATPAEQGEPDAGEAPALASAPQVVASAWASP